MPMLQVKNPFDDSLVGQAPLLGAAELDAAVERAQAAFEVVRLLAPFERARVLADAAAALKARRDEFAGLICAEAGKPITLAETEVDRAVVTITAAAEEAKIVWSETLDLGDYPISNNHVGHVKRFPIGVIYGITPFNFPLNLVLHKLAPAIATGNAIIIKPSPRTPLTAIRIVELLHACGLPKDQAQVVVCANELATRIIDDDRIKHVSFTGSDKIGYAIRKQAWNKRVTLELGGNAAMIVHDDADLALAASSAASGAFAYAGQTCISVQRILVQKNVYERFRTMLVNKIRETIHVGDPRDRKTVVGPMISDDAQRRVLAAIEQALQHGATLLTGGKAIGKSIEPTLLENVDPAIDVCAEEIFAPVAVLRPYDRFDDALRLVNDSVYGLQAGVFTKGRARIDEAFEKLEVGGVLINQAPTWRSDIMPYGGVKRSGFGREGIRYAMQEMTELKTFVMRVS